MKLTKISKYSYNRSVEFPKTKKEPHRHEVWIALFPYETLGNMEKMRPVYITSINEEEDKVRCKMITTNPKHARKIKGTLSKSKPFNKISYLKDKTVEIPIYKLYGKIRNGIELEEE